jgi:hypothetical protein
MLKSRSVICAPWAPSKVACDRLVPTDEVIVIVRAGPSLRLIETG